MNRLTSRGSLVLIFKDSNSKHFITSVTMVNLNRFWEAGSSTKKTSDDVFISTSNTVTVIYGFWQAAVLEWKVGVNQWSSWTAVCCTAISYHHLYITSLGGIVDVLWLQYLLPPLKGPRVSWANSSHLPCFAVRRGHTELMVLNDVVVKLKGKQQHFSPTGHQVIKTCLRRLKCQAKVWGHKCVNNVSPFYYYCCV